MSCSPFDLRDYFLKELADPQQRRQVEVHVATCQSCSEELDRLQTMEAALFNLRDEEIPQRIAFVSDKVFEPSPLRRWMAGFWNSSARLGFASAAMLSTALIVFAATRPAPAPVRVVSTTAVVDQADIERRVQDAADHAAKTIEARYAAKLDALTQKDLRERRLIMASFDAQSAYTDRVIQGLRQTNRQLQSQFALSRDEGEKQ